MNWTEKQEEAISLRGKNMLVSAAAGSGKTAVLVERIKQLIIKDKIGIDHILIVTFTNAAAAEMKEKIIRAITEELKTENGNSLFLRKQLNKINNANISTFHAFALEVIRRYFYLTDIEPNFVIGDEAQVEILRKDVLDELFEKQFEEENPQFLQFLRAYGSDRNEKALKENILKLYQTIYSIPDPLDWLREHTEQMAADEETFFQSSAAKLMTEDILSGLNSAVHDFSEASAIAESAGIESIYEKNKKDLEQIEAMAERAPGLSFDELGSMIRSYKASVMRASKEDKEAYDAVKAQFSRARDRGKEWIKTLKIRYFQQPFSVCLEDMQQTAAHGKFLQEILIKFDEAYKAAKRERNIIDFSDIEHYGLQILGNAEAAGEYREKFDYIFIDEYQDSNLIQDTLIGRIKRENNLFMVGDIKQSIYKFRLAEPEIFEEKYRIYSAEDSENSMKLDLNQNFRSKKEVIDTVNLIFYKIMAGYNEDAALYQGAPYDGSIHYETELHLVDRRIDEGMELEEEIAEMKAAELEAHAAAEIIKSALGQPIYDSKKQTERQITCKDIVILMRGIKNYADIFTEVFSEQDIPAYVDSSSGYFDAVEIQVFLNVLRVLDNQKQDLPLLSLMRSFIGGFSIEEMIEIRLSHREGAYCRALEHYRQSGEIPQLRQKCSQMEERISQWKERLHALPLDDFLWKLMWDTGYYTYCGALPAGKQRQANLRLLIDRARAFQEKNYTGIYGFLSYIDDLQKREIPTGQVKLVGENDDIVRLMTIHKSKGLEFPVVIVAGLGKKFNFDRTGRGIVLHKDVGIGMTRTEPKEHWYRKTLTQTIIEQKTRKENLEEELRVLYVALTRAKDRLVLLGTAKEIQDGIPAEADSRNCYLDFLIPFALSGEIPYYVHDRMGISGNLQRQTQNREYVLSLFDEIEREAGSGRGQTELDQAIDRRLSFQYENKGAGLIKSKYTVTELNQSGEQSRVNYSLKTPAFTKDKTALSAAEKGTIMHKVMECISFRDAFAAASSGKGVQYIDAFIKEMTERELLTEKEAAAADREKIERFFCTDLGKRAASAKELHRESEFNLIREFQGTEIMVQGIIDCYFEEDGELVLIDYKNNYIAQKNTSEAIETVREKYRQQIELYKEALETIRKKPVKEAYLYLFSRDCSLKY